MLTIIEKGTDPEYKCHCHHCNSHLSFHWKDTKLTAEVKAYGVFSKKYILLCPVCYQPNNVTEIVNPAIAQKSALEIQNIFNDDPLPLDTGDHKLRERVMELYDKTIKNRIGGIEKKINEDGKSAKDHAEAVRNLREAAKGYKPQLAAHRLAKCKIWLLNVFIAIVTICTIGVCIMAYFAYRSHYIYSENVPSGTTTQKLNQ